MTAVNEVVWRCFFKIMHLITDNTGLCILMFAAATAILPVLLSWKRAEILAVLLSYLSVRDMLLHLSGIHPRINTMLGTSSEIISGSGRYLHALPGLNGKTLSKKGGITMKETTNAMINGMQGELNQLTWHGGRQGDLDSGTWHGGRQGDLDSGTWHGGRQGDLDGGTWHSYEANDTAARSRDGPLT